ncbi:MAG: pilus assembly protein PilM [Chloroflexi bacterium]|nr:pilus assembly protein PilM [Chloroflexota bacterium]
MAQKIVTLYIDDTSIRLIVTRGERIKKWADLPLEPGLVKNTVVVDEAKVAAKIRQLFRERKVNSSKVVVGVSGANCFSRPIVLPQLPGAMLTEAVKREAKRLLPVPLDQLYLSWQTMPAPAGKIQVFLVAIPCKTADALLRTLHQAGLKPSLMDLKPLLLARVVNEATAVAIIVDVQTTEFDIVIMSGGIPQPVRNVSLPGDALSWPHTLPLIRDELDRTIKFFNDNNHERPLAATAAVLISGEMAREPELCQSLSDQLGRPVYPLSSPLVCPQGLDPNRYLANIGLVLKKSPLRQENRHLLVNLDILPVPYRPKPPSLTRVLALPGAVSAIGILILFTMLIQGAAADIASARGQLEAAAQLSQQRLAERQRLLEDIARLEKKVAEVEANENNFATALTALEKQRNATNGSLATAVNTLPGTITPGSIAYSNGVLTMSGTASTEDEILSYLRQLDDSGIFSEITISGIKRTGDDRVDFTFTLKVGG